MSDEKITVTWREAIKAIIWLLLAVIIYEIHRFEYALDANTQAIVDLQSDIKLIKWRLHIDDNSQAESAIGVNVVH